MLTAWLTARIMMDYTLALKTTLNNILDYAYVTFIVNRSATRLKWHKLWPVCFTMLNSKLYILTELNANDVNVISIDRQNLDLLNDV